MTRALQKRSDEILAPGLDDFLKRDMTDYEKWHDDFCVWAQGAIKTSRGKTPSYGQVAKVLDVAMKVVASAQRTSAQRWPIDIPKLHCGIDGYVLAFLREKNSTKALVLTDIDKQEYFRLQAVLKKMAREMEISGLALDEKLRERQKRKIRLLNEPA